MTAHIVDGVILAAGLSSRMGRVKPLLEIGQITFLERAARTLRKAGCRRTYVVVNPDATWLDRAHALDLDIVINSHPESQQIDSVRLVIERLPADTEGILVLPVDVPLVSDDTVAAVVAAFQEEPAPLVLPFHNTVAGHPVLLGRAIFDELLTRALEEGVRSVIMSHARDLREVKVVDPGILIDIDTPDDYWRYIEQKQ